MTPDPDLAFDGQARAAHAAALASLSPRVRSRLAAMRRDAALASPHAHGRWHWLAATACSAVLAVALGLHLQPDRGTAQRPAGATAADTSADDYGTGRMLDENPDLYVWLGSDNHLLAQE